MKKKIDGELFQEISNKKSNKVKCRWANRAREKKRERIERERERERRRRRRRRRKTKGTLVENECNKRNEGI